MYHTSYRIQTRHHRQAVFVIPAAHEIQVLFETYSFTAQYVTLHVVSDPEESSPSSFVVPAAHATQALFETRSFEAQSVTSYVVSDPEAS